MIVQAMPYPPVTLGLTDDLRLLLNFDGADGSTTFTDSSNYARTVTPSGTAQLDTAFVKTGTAAGLFAIDDQLSVADSNDFHLGTEPFTIGMWVRSARDAPQLLIGQYDTGTTDNWGVTLDTFGGLGFGATTNGTDFSLSASAVVDGSGSVWTSVIVSRNASGKVRLRANGVMVASASGNTSSIDNVAAPLRIGKSDGFFGAADHLQFAGSLDLLYVIVGQDLFDTDSTITPPTSYPATQPVFSVDPVITSDSGFYAEGDGLTATPGTFSPTVLSSSSYQWKRDGAAISGETGFTYTLVADDVGTVITFTHSATNPNGTANRTSAATPTIGTPTYQADTRIAGSDTRIAGTDTRTVQTRIS